ncbi:MAG: thioredoxin domain-containing protein, partial [Candidatus Saccharibacteria bacterium]|nr:thioredoxin domain-containing protein [Candidatus Saccharibacteria bacterium]
MLGKIVRGAALGGILFLILGLIIYNSTRETDFSEKVWDEGTTVGETKAKHHFVMYTDLACPYCDVFSRTIMNNEEEFSQLIADNSILYEVRVTEFLYEYGEGKIDMSRWSAKGVQCAKNEGRFWDYYHQALKNLWNDYHSKGIGVSKTSPMITGMTEDYWVKVGKDAGFSEAEFRDCMAKEETIAQVEEGT